MSMTYTLACDTCREKFWAGQSSSAGDYIYDAGIVEAFLFKHSEHELRFLNDLNDDKRAMGYRDVEKDFAGASLVVKLPEALKQSESVSEGEAAASEAMLDACREAIEEAGVKVKP